MSDESEFKIPGVHDEEDTPVPAAPRRDKREEDDALPHERRKLRAGAAVLAAIALLTGALIAVYFATRPADLRAYTDRLSSEVAQLFRNRHIPTLRFREMPPEVRRDAGAVWTHHELRAELPPELSVEAVADIIRRQTALQNVQLVEMPLNEAEGMQLRMELRGREYATVRLRGGASGSRGTDQAARRLMEARVLLAQAVRDALLEAGLPAEAIVERLPATRSEAPARLEARLGQTLTPSRALDAIERGLAPHDVRLRMAPAAAGVYVTLLDEDTRLVEVLLKRPGPGDDFDVSSRTLEPPQETLPPLEALPMESDGASPGPVDGAALPPADTARPRVAIIVDDGGYGGDVTEQVLALDPGLTLAILPFTPHAEDTARLAATRGFEVLLHMPMASGDAAAAFPGELTVGMAPDELSAATTKALLSVPGAAGVNNHTGSAYTQNEAAMRAFLECVRDAGLFFVDSRTTAETVAYDVAAQMDVPAGQRDLFLDNDPAPAAIEARFAELLDTARARGSAIGICHFRPNTATALARLLPRLPEAGVELVHVSELLTPGGSE